MYLCKCVVGLQEKVKGFWLSAQSKCDEPPHCQAQHHSQVIQTYQVVAIANYQESAWDQGDWW